MQETPLFVNVLQYILNRAMLPDELQSSLPSNSCSENYSYAKYQMHGSAFKTYIMQDINIKNYSINSKMLILENFLLISNTSFCASFISLESMRGVFLKLRKTY